MSTSPNLHDIVEAEAISWWPPAWGWWVVLAALIVAVTLLSVAIIRRRRRHRAQKLALHNLHQTSASVGELTLLTKQAALAYFPRHDIAALSGKRWFDFLIHTMPQSQQADFAARLRPWADALYAPAAQPADDYQQLMQYWVKHALPPKHPEVPDV